MWNKRQSIDTFRYAGPTPVNEDDMIELLDTNLKPFAMVPVIDALSSQFTVEWEGQHKFLFYNKVGMDWRATKYKAPRQLELPFEVTPNDTVPDIDMLPDADGECLANHQALTSGSKTRIV